MKGVKRSLAFWTLLQMGIRITLVVIAVTLLSYWHIVTTLEEEAHGKLYKYITERSQSVAYLKCDSLTCPVVKAYIISL